MGSEIWKPIIGYEGLYEVSDQGSVRSLRYNNTNEIRKLVLRRRQNGYMCVTLCKNNIKKFPSVHRIVARHFVPNPHEKPQVNHLNEDKTDNRAANLAWCTSEENNNYGAHNSRISAAMTNGKTSKAIFAIEPLEDTVTHYFPSVHEAARQGFCRRSIGRSLSSNGERLSGGLRWYWLGGGIE